MSLRLKLVVTIIFVALVPLTMAAFTFLNLHEESSNEAVRAIHNETAGHGSSIARTYFDFLEQSLSSVVRSIQWSDLSSEERSGALWLVYRGRDDIAAVTLLDHTGKGLSAAVYAEADTRDEALSRHPPASMAVLKGFADHIPFQGSLERGVAFGDAFAPDGSTGAFISMALRVQGPNEAIWVVAVCVSLEALCANISGNSAKNIQTYLVDPLGRLLCRPSPSKPVEPADPGFRRLVLGSKNDSLRRYSPSGEDLELVIATSEAARGWTVVAEQLASNAFATSTRMRSRIIYFLGLGILAGMAVGLILARRIVRPIAELLDGALELAKGNFSFKLPVTGRDELGQLSEAFNHMGAEIAKRDGEIRAWNEDLQNRVKEHTHDLREAQQQLIQSQKIAAVTALGAGIAHEINNPLTGVIGLTQIIMADPEINRNEEHMETLRTIEREALRVKGIVRSLLTLSQEYAGEGFSPLDLKEVLEESLEVVQTEMKKRGIEIERDCEEDIPQVLGNKTQLQQVFLHLMDNARIAMPKGGKLRLAMWSVDGQLVKVSVADTGRGIPPENMEKIVDPFFTTKDNWKSEGLGLTVAFRIVEKHNGTIKPMSEVGVGTTMLVTLPAAKFGTHLK